MTAVELKGRILDENGNGINDVTVTNQADGEGTPANTFTTSGGTGAWEFTGRDAGGDLEESKVWKVIMSKSGTQVREVYGGIKAQVDKLFVKSKLSLADGGTLHLPDGTVTDAFLAAGITNAKLGTDVYRRNLLYNGGFEVWQRGAGSFFTTGDFTADMWRITEGTGSGLTIDRGTTYKDTYSRYSLHGYHAKVTGNSFLYQNVCQTNIDDTLLAELRGKTLTFTMRVKANAANAVRLALWDGATYTYSSYHTGGDTYETLSVSAAMASDASYITVYVYFENTVTFDLDNATLVIGSVGMTHYPVPYVEDLLKCMPYYEVIGSGVQYEQVAAGMCESATLAVFNINFKTPKPVVPGVTISIPTHFEIAVGGSAIACTDITADYKTTYSCRLVATVAGGLTTGHAVILRGNINSDGQIRIQVG